MGYGVEFPELKVVATAVVSHMDYLLQGQLLEGPKTGSLKRMLADDIPGVCRYVGRVMCGLIEYLEHTTLRSRIWAQVAI